MNAKFLALATLASAAVFATSARAQTIGCVAGGAGGIIPTTGTGGGGTFPGTFPTAPSTFALNVAAIPAGATVVTEVKLLGLTHTYVSDLQFVLTDPSNVTYNVFCRPSTPTGGAFSCEFGGDYTLVPSCTVPVNAFPAACASPTVFTTGAYDQHFGSGTLAWPSGTNGISNTRLDSIAASTGMWKLTCYDWAGADVGALTSWELCFGTPATPGAPTAAPLLSTPADGASLFGPSVSLTWSAAACATSYEIDVDGTIYSSATTSYAYTSTAGSHTWTVRGLNTSGQGPWATSRTFNDLGVPPSSCTGPSLSTVYLGGNGLGTGSCVYFDVNVTNPLGISVSQLDTSATATVGTPFTLTVYTRTGTYVGSQLTSVGWTQVSTGGGVAIGTNLPSVVELPDFPLPFGVTGFCVVITGAGHNYTNGNGANQLYSNADLSISLGESQATPFVSTPFTPRVWNGGLRYNCAPPGPVVYCTAGTSTNGCVPSISASAQPSATLASACLLSVANVEGVKSGLLFYGINNSGFSPVPWGTGSNSWLCIKAPTQRMVTQNSGGTLGQCNGSLSQDWNAFQTANPTSLGNPFASGQKVFAQAWYRDPTAIKTTNLSNAIEMTMQP